MDAADQAVPWSLAADGIVLTVRLTPKGGRDAVDGIAHMDDGRAALKVRVRALPTAGEANAALIQVIAGAIGVAPRAVALIGGATARIKRLRITGDAAALAVRLQNVAKVKHDGKRD